MPLGHARGERERGPMLSSSEAAAAQSVTPQLSWAVAEITTWEGEGEGERGLGKGRGPRVGVGGLNIGGGGGGKRVNTTIG